MQVGLGAQKKKTEEGCIEVECTMDWGAAQDLQNHVSQQITRKGKENF